ncbi:hypothetical protein cypCar_00016236 [Cyprinus carpio]|nr:hypothetical protein cypCar_00016236 [Cyprinus carpio]
MPEMDINIFQLLTRCWKVWQLRLDQAEDRSLQPRMSVAQAHHKFSVWRSCFHSWRKRLTEHRQMQELELCADACFARHIFPQCVNTWMEFAAQRTEKRERKERAEQQYRQVSAVKIERSRLAVGHFTPGGDTWRYREIKDLLKERQRHFEQAEDHYGQRCLRRAMADWHQYVEYKRQKSEKLARMEKHYNSRLLRHSLEAWKSYHLQTQLISQNVERRYQEHQQHLVGRMFCSWWMNVSQLMEEREKENRAKCFSQKHLLSQVFLAWRHRTISTHLHHQQQEEVLKQARRHLDIFRVQVALRRWRERSTELQTRRTEAEKTETALWHWSLNLQAKVFCMWRFWIAERQRKQKRLTEAAQFYRDELLREGVTHILTHTAHMSAFSTNIAQHSYEQSCRHLQELVRRCAIRWKQRALCKPVKGKTDSHPTKSVSFFLPEDHTPITTPCPISSQAAEQRQKDSIISQLWSVRASRLQPRRPDDLLQSPFKPLPRDFKISSSQRVSVRETSPLPSVYLTHNPPESPGMVQQPKVLLFKPGPPGYIASHGQDILLPPSSFTVSLAHGKQKSLKGQEHPLHSTHFTSNPLLTQGMHERIPEQEEENEEDETVDVEQTENLTKELLDIRLEMQQYQQDRKQLQTWRKLQKVLSNWLETTGIEGETEERESILKELREVSIYRSLSLLQSVIHAFVSLNVQ